MSQPAASVGDVFSGTMPVAERQRFDTARLQAWLRAHVEGFDDGGRAIEVEQFKGGQSNPTFRITAGNKQYVLRRKPAGKLLPSAPAVDREYRVISALGRAGIPVARAYCLCLDESVIGTAFYVMDCVDGRVLWDPALPGFTPAQRGAVFAEMNRVIAALHKVDYASAGLGDYGRTGSYIERQVARWTKQYRSSETETIDAMDRLITWLPANVPPDEQTSVVHGDYRLDNLMFHPTGPRIVAVLDWELSTLGHPLADFAYHCTAWLIPAGMFRGVGGLDLARLGIPTMDEYVAMYCRNTGRAAIDPDHWDFYLAYNLFRGAAILQGIMGRVKDGTATSRQALEAGRAARPMAELAWQQVERILARK
ncbi:MAG: phosphotransferase [Gammaproteobacteria bacterium]